MKRKWGLRGSVCLLGCLLLTGCGAETDYAETGASVQEDSAADTAAVGEAGEEIVLYELPTEAEAAEIYVEPIKGLSEDFMRGVDISSVLAQEKSGVIYYNEAGEEQDIFQTLAQSGVNYIRVRVWNDPYDAEGNSYGGGNCDVSAAAEIGKRAAQYGMKLCVDFHYSDFWADPKKQMCPKAWEGSTVDEKAEALRTYTVESLQQILDAGAEVGMVQIGNEINNGIAGETDWSSRLRLLAAGAAGVREVSKEQGREMKVAVHFTDITDKDYILDIADRLSMAELDYDVFAVSYYPFWHGSQENLVDVLKSISGNYEKQVVIAENSYLYTAEDGDGSANSIGAENEVESYTISVQGQANEIRDICAAVASVGEAGLGYFYWEPAWIPVQTYDPEAENAAEILAENKESWETNGSGWASSYASEYDPKDAGVYYGGSSWDNQALFDFEGHPLASLKTFRYLYHGTNPEKHVYAAENLTIEAGIGEGITLPEEVNIIYNDQTTEPAPVVWDTESAGVGLNEDGTLDTSKGGEYEIFGTFSGENEELADLIVTAMVTVERENLLKNPGFEEADYSMWTISSESGSVTDYQDKEADAYSGTIALHFWSEDELSFTAEQTLEGLEPGTYECGFYLQGGDVGDSAAMALYVDTAAGHDELATGVDGWCSWQNPTLEAEVGEDGKLTIGASISSGPGGWGTLDDFYCYQSSAAKE